MPEPGTVKISATVDIGNTLNDSIRKNLAASPLGKGFDSRGFQEGMKPMNAAVRQFDQQLDRANKRVVALGSAGAVLYGTIRAFREMVVATVQVEKSLASINSIFQLTGRELDTFSKRLFTAANQTGQSFKDAAKAAEEFSRQGLGMMETIKRTRDAMVLVRLTGLDAAKSVDLLTAAVNTFGKTGADTTSIINKLVAVDQQFAVSAKDIAEAMARVGSVVEDANVTLDQFTGLVTAAKQITSRDGAVIGNSLKTIFTRLERSSTLDQLEALGVAVRDVSGNVRPAIEVFNELAQSYRTLNREQQQQVAELGGGVFQINQFKALLLDLGKANGIAAQATKASTEATNEALIRNAALNNTLAASVQTLQNSATQAASTIGQLTLAPGLKRILGEGQAFADLFGNVRSTGDTKAAEDMGAYLGESILKGIGNVLAGPGLIFAVRAALGVTAKTLREAGADVGQSAGFVTNTVRSNMNRLGMGGEAQSMQTVNNLLAQGTKEEQARFRAAKTVADQEAVILGILQQQVMTLAQLGGAVGVRGGGLRGGAARRTPGAAAGYLPIGEEAAAISAGVGGAPRTARPVYLPGFRRPDGNGIVANSSEWIAPGAAGGYPSILTRDMIRRNGLPPGSTPVAAAGFIPNAAMGGLFSEGSLRPAPGSGVGLTIPKTQIDSLNTLFVNISRAATLADASKLATQIKDLTKAMDVGSQSRVLKELNTELKRFGQFKSLYGSAPSAALPGGPNVLGSVGFPRLYTSPAAGPYRSKGNLEDINNAFSGSTVPLRSNALMANVSIAAAAGVFAANQSLGGKALPLAAPSVLGGGRAPIGLGSRLLGGAEMYGPPAPYRVSNEGILSAGTLDKSQSLAAELARADRAKAAQQKEALRQELLTQDRRQRLAARANNLQGGLIAGSFGSAFLPEGTSGEASGKLFGSLGGGLQGAAIGGGIGSVFGPIGTIAGAAVGGFVGAIRGFIERSSKSFEELAKEINDANSRSAQMINSASQFRAFQDTIKGAIDKGGSSQVVNDLFRQQRAVAATLPSSTVRRLLEAGFDEEKLNEVFSSMSAAESEQAAKRNLLGGLGSLRDPKTGSEGIAATANALRTAGGNSDVGGLLRRIQAGGGRLTTGQVGNLGAVGAGGAAPSYYVNRGSGMFIDAGAVGVARSEVDKQIEDLIKQSSLDETQKAEAIKQVKEANDERVLQFLTAYRDSADVGPLLNVQQRAQGQLNSLRSSVRGLLRSRGEQEALGGVAETFSTRLRGIRERTSLGFGDLSEQASLGLSGGFSLAAAQREAATSNASAFRGARNQFLSSASALGNNPSVLQAIESAGSVGDLEAIIAKSFKGDEIRDKLTDVVTELKVTVAQNGTMVELTKEQNRLDQLALEAAQQNRLLSAGTFSGGTGSAARSVFSRLRNSRGAAQGANAVALGGFLDQMGLPQTDEGLSFDREVRGASVRDNLAAVLSARLKRRVGSSAGEIKAANDELAQSGALGDSVVSGRIGAGLKSLSFDPAAARKELLGGNVSGGTLAQLASNGQVNAGTLVLKGPLDAISTSTKGSEELLSQIKSLLQQQQDVVDRAKTTAEAISYQQLARTQGLPFGGATSMGNVADLTGTSGVVSAAANAMALAFEATIPRIMDAMEAATEAGAESGTEKGVVTMGEYLVNGGRRDPPPSLVDTFSTGFQGGFERSILGSDFKTIEEAMNSLADVGERVGASLEQNLGNAFGDFVTGAQKGKDAFRSFVVGVLGDAARAMASKAVQQLLGFLLTSFIGDGTGISTEAGAPVTFRGKAAGGYVSLASGGKVPALLTSGEYVFDAPAARRLGPSLLNGLNRGTIKRAGGGMVAGGSGVMDDVPAMLNPGAFVVRKAMTERYGAPYLASLAGGGTVATVLGGGSMNGGTTVTMSPSTMAPLRFSDGGSVSGILAGGGATSVQIGITINDQRTTATSTTQSGGGSDGENGGGNQQLAETMAARMKMVALQTIEEQTRVGGMLRKQSLRNT